MSDLVQLAKIDGIAVITINNPPVNALSSAVSAGVAAASRRLTHKLPA
jgi:enoyl-CoA hydratase/carnithine racemase